jgi:membrane peptidoglycan carboxypeptidase
VPVLQVQVRRTKQILETHLEEDLPKDQERVLKEATADNVTAILRGVLEPGGTAAGKGIGRPAAGKTGTAQDAANAWFAGYTPALSAAVWMGFPAGNIPMKGIKGVREVTGGSFPAATWQAFMKTALRNVPATEFNEPAPIEPPQALQLPRRREDFRPGDRRTASGTDEGGPYTYDLGPPQADAPTTTTTTTIPFEPGTSTTTTRPTIGFP